MLNEISGIKYLLATSFPFLSIYISLSFHLCVFFYAIILASRTTLLHFYFFSGSESPHFNIQRLSFSFSLIYKITFLEDSILSINDILKYKFCMNCNCGEKREKFLSKKLANVPAVLAA